MTAEKALTARAIKKAGVVAVDLHAYGRIQQVVLTVSEAAILGANLMRCSRQVREALYQMMEEERGGVPGEEEVEPCSKKDGSRR